MKKNAAFLILLSLGLFQVGCAFPSKTLRVQEEDGNVVREALARSGKTPPEDIQVYFRDDKIGHPFVKLGQVICATRDMKVDPEMLLNDFKVKASEIGANAIILEQATSVNSWKFIVIALIPGESFAQRATAILVETSKAIPVEEKSVATPTGSTLQKNIPLDRLSFPPKY